MIVENHVGHFFQLLWSTSGVFLVMLALTTLVLFFATLRMFFKPFTESQRDAFRLASWLPLIMGLLGSLHVFAKINYSLSQSDGGVPNTFWVLYAYSEASTFLLAGGCVSLFFLIVNVFMLLFRQAGTPRSSGGS
jgi:uncharacterized membrane protein